VEKFVEVTNGTLSAQGGRELAGDILRLPDNLPIRDLISLVKEKEAV
jgi:uncharacterized ubiquitin-like protein YukD